MCFDQRRFLGLSVSLLALVGVGAEKPLSTAVGAAFPSPVDCVRACPDGAASAKRLWNGISPQVKEWELSKRAETLRWFEEHQFGKTPIGRPADEKLGGRRSPRQWRR